MYGLGGGNFALRCLMARWKAILRHAGFAAIPLKILRRQSEPNRRKATRWDEPSSDDPRLSRKPKSLGTRSAVIGKGLSAGSVWNRHSLQSARSLEP